MIPIQIKSKRRTKQLNVANGNGPMVKSPLMNVISTLYELSIVQCKKDMNHGIKLEVKVLLKQCLYDGSSVAGLCQ